jgi:hypothetical protein
VSNRLSLEMKRKMILCGVRKGKNLADLVRHRIVILLLHPWLKPFRQLQVAGWGVENAFRNSTARGNSL